VPLWFGRRDNGLGARTQTDHQGRFRAALVPGLLFQMGATSKFPLQSPPGFMTVESGKTKDLGDLLLDMQVTWIDRRSRGLRMNN
jgi:hypothetical protein